MLGGVTVCCQESPDCGPAGAGGVARLERGVWGGGVDD